MNWKSYKKYFKGKKILITGNSGFVGSYLSLTLSLLGSKILGYSLKKKDNRFLSNFSDYKKKLFLNNFYVSSWNIFIYF